jgi:hypothetical protein
MRDGGFVNLLKASPVWPTRAMNTPATPNRYKHHRFPGEIISHGVWLYDRFYLSYRDVEELLFERGVIVTYEAIRKWCRKFQTPPDLVVKFQPIDMVDVILRLVLRPRVVYQREITG